MRGEGEGEEKEEKRSGGAEIGGYFVSVWRVGVVVEGSLCVSLAAGDSFELDWKSMLIRES